MVHPKRRIFRPFFYLALAVFAMGPGFMACVTTNGQDAAAVPATDQTAARRFLEDYWPKGREFRSAAEQLFAESPHTSPVMAAYTLQRMRQNRNREATEIGREWVETSPEDSVGWFTSAWLSAVTDDFDRAVADLRGWTSAIQKNPMPPDLNDVMLRQVGRMLGYLEGPVADRVNPDALDVLKESIKNSLPQDAWDLVEQQRTATLAEFQTFTAKKDTIEQEEMQRLRQEAAQQEAALKQENEMLQKRFDSLGTERQQVESDVSNRIAQLETQAVPLRQSAASLQAQIDSINFELQRLIVQLTLLQNQLCDRPNDDYLRFVIVDMNARLRDLDYQRSIAISNYDSVLSQLNALDRQAAMVRQEGMARMAQLRAEAEEIQKRLRWNRKKLVKLAQPPKVSSAKAGAIENRATSLTSYAPFPLELVRDHLLKSL